MLRARTKLVPESQCSWAILPPSSSRRRTREELGFEFERFLPHPIEHYAVDFVRQSDGSHIALGVSREFVASVRATHDAVRPESLPDVLSAEVSPPAFELARGRLIPIRLLNLQRLTAALIAMLVVGASTLLTLGLLTRAQQLTNEGATLRTLANDAYRNVLPSDTPTSQPRAILVQGLLRQSRQAAATATDLSMPDVRADVASMLTAWPEGNLRMRQLSVDRDSAVIEILLDANLDASTLLKSFGTMPGWRQSAPVVRRKGADQRVTIRLTRVPREPAS